MRHEEYMRKRMEQESMASSAGGSQRQLDGGHGQQSAALQSGRG